MKVNLNNEETECTEECDLEQFLRNINIFSKKGIAVALNNKVISKMEWNKTKLAESDDIIVIVASQGG